MANSIISKLDLISDIDAKLSKANAICSLVTVANGSDEIPGSAIPDGLWAAHKPDQECFQAVGRVITRITI